MKPSLIQSKLKGFHMKKYLLPVIVVLLLCSGVFYQWTRSEQQMVRLNQEMSELERDLWMMDKVRKHRSAIEEDIRALDTVIRRLESRIPSAPQKDDFAGQLAAQLAPSNITIILEPSRTRERDFYRETTLRFSFNGKMPEKSVLMEIFHNMDRLVRWEMIRPDNILETRIYSTMFVLDIEIPGIRPCEDGSRVTVNYWPFNTGVRQGMNQLREKCLQRRSGAALLVPILQLEGRRKYKLMLEEIVKQLDIDAGKQEKMMNTQDSWG